MKKVLVLGAGMVAKPLARYLLDHGFQVTMATRTVSKAEKILDGHEHGKAVSAVIDQLDLIEKLVTEHDLAISLLPYTHHCTIARMCIKHKKPMVTTSYVSEEMNGLDAEAKGVGILLLNEIGLDPGIDHMSAMRIIDHVHGQGGEIKAFYSFCGGLPAPEATDNPFGYKFSWSPIGVLLAGRNSARFKENGKIVEIPGEELFSSSRIEEVEGLGKFEVYPNRDSIPYIDIYGIQESDTVMRGTYRNLGWCDTLKAIATMGYLSPDERDGLEDKTLGDITKMLVGAPAGADAKQAVVDFLKIDPGSHTIKSMEWLGLFGDDPAPSGKRVIDVLSALMVDKMSLKPGERDLAILRHQFLAVYPDHKDDIVSLLIDYGIPHGDTTMARTVGLPAAIGSRMVLEGKIDLTGVHCPVIPEIYNPVLEELARQNIEMKETFTPVSGD